MSENRWQAVFRTIENFSQAAQYQLSQLFTGAFVSKSPTLDARGLYSLSRILKPPLKIDSTTLQPNAKLTPRTIEVKSGAPASKEELGRATWTFLHTLAAQYPKRPTKIQKKDVRELMEILSRLYPCKECADHFKIILRKKPVQAESQAELAEWLCDVHNNVNKRLGKTPFPCKDVDKRWGKLECEQGECEVPGTAVEGRH